MALPLPPEYAPMEADTARALPEGPEWQYEPKWDGFRCLAFRDGSEVHIQSKAGQPLARYFPEMVDALLAVEAKRFILDGELVIVQGKSLDFDALLQRIHPAETRIRKLAKDTPATLIVFDLLADERGRLLADKPLRERRPALERFASEYFGGHPGLRLSPATCKLREARRWLETLGGSLDGVIAKRLDVPYASAERSAMLKIKNLRTADCVVGGFRYAAKGKQVGSLLLGLYDSEGRLNHVGFTSAIAAAEKPALTARLESLVEAPGFTGSTPGGPSRWSRGRDTSWQPLRPELVLEVQYDHFSGGRFRHGTKPLRWRPDKRADQCTLAQVEREANSPIGLLSAA